MDAKRIAPPLVLLAAGAGLLVYGAAFRRLTVHAEQEVEVQVVVPTPFGPLLPFDRPLPGDDPLGDAVPERDEGSPEDVDPFASPRERDPFAAPAEPPERDPFAAPAEPERDPFASPAEAPEPKPFASPPPESADHDPFAAFFEKRTPTELVSREEPEWVLVFEATIGGVVRLANGDLKRTYIGEPPGVCPT
jgi:hypothetical protein